MRPKLALIHMSLGVLGCIASPPALADDCTKNVASFDMLQDADGQFVIPSTIDDTNQLMGVELGAAHSAIYSDVAERLKLSLKRIGVQAIVQQQIVSSMVVAPTLVIGHAAGNNRQFVVIPNRQNIDAQTAGWFGLDVLANFDIDLDFGNQKINLFTPNQCGEKLTVYWTANYAVVPMNIQPLGNFTFPAQLDGHDLSLTLTNLKSGLIGMSSANRLFGLTPSSPGMQPVPEPVLTGQNFFSYPFKSLTVGGVSIPNPVIYLYDDLTRATCGSTPNCRGMEAMAAIGLSALSPLHIYVAYKKKEIFISSGNQ